MNVLSFWKRCDLGEDGNRDISKILSPLLPRDYHACDFLIRGMM